MSRPWQALALTLALALTSGCATTMSIRSMQPGIVPIGSAKHLVLLGGEGRRSAREFVGQELARQCRGRGYFSFEDRSEEGLSVHIAGRQASVEGAEFALGSDHLGLRIDVLEWSGQSEEEEVECTNSSGQQYMKRVPVMHGNALLAITLFDSSGRAHLAETEYEGGANTAVSAPREECIEGAARMAIASLMHDITPMQVVTRVRLDDEDTGQEAFLATACAGGTAQAAHDLEAYLAQNPNNASAAYNLAVLREAMGDFESALEMYDRALSLGAKDFYAQARAGCASRLSAEESLSAENPR